MNIAFRTDATCQIGTGHFMRCLTLAKGLKQRGAALPNPLQFREQICK
jgi:spore coat polysaccharide biosynthesis predicted glycosyltransferase SpsG